MLLHTVVGDPDACGDEHLKLILLVRFLDLVSVNEIRRAIVANGQAHGVIVFRMEKETDFKMSCHHCGQKLWVRDTDVGQKGRCPKCSKSIELPGQEAHIREQFGLGAEVQITRTKPGQVRDSIQLIEQVAGGTGLLFDQDLTELDNLKNETVRIQIPEDID